MKNIIRNLVKSLVPRSYQTTAKILKSIILSSSTAEQGFRWGKNLSVNSETNIIKNNLQLHSENTSLNALETYFESHTEGLGILKWKHYFNIYHRHFSKFVGQKVHILEVGVASGGSLEMWKNYFGSNCQIYGVDIEEKCKAYEDDSIKMIQLKFLLAIRQIAVSGNDSKVRFLPSIL